MPDLLHLRSQAVKNPELYKQEVLAYAKALDARIELFKLQPQYSHYEMLELFYFLYQLAPLYEELRPVIDKAFELLGQLGPMMNPQTRYTLLKLGFSEYFVLDKNGLDILMQIVAIKDKQNRVVVQSIILYKFKKNVANAQLDVLCNGLRTQSKTVKQFLIRLFAVLYQRKVLKSSAQHEKIVNAVAYALIDSNDKHVIKLSLNFLTNADYEDDIYDDDDEEGPTVVVTDEDRYVEISKLTNKLRYRITKFSIDERKKKKDIDALRKQIIRLHTKLNAENPTQLYIIDYIRDPQTFGEYLIKKFLQRDAPFALRCTIMSYLAQLSERYELIVPQFYTFAARYLRPRQQEVKYIISAVVQSIHAHTPVDDAVVIIRQLMNEFVHSGATDEEMTVAITAITEIAKRVPDVFQDDNYYILNELVSFSRDKQVSDAHDALKSGSKTSARTRKGVINASRELLNFYRIRAPDLLEKKYLNKDAALRLQQYKRDAAGEQAGDAEEESASESSSESEEKPSKHQIKKRKADIKKIFAYLKHCRQIGKTLSEAYASEYSAVLGYDIDLAGNRIYLKTDALVRLPDDWEHEPVEESYMNEEEYEEMSADGSAESSSMVTLSDEPSFVYDEYVPIKQQRPLTDEELEKLRSMRQDERDKFDIDAFVTRAKSTAEERRRISKQSKDPESHKSNFWNRKAEGKSRTNKEKQVNKPMLMVLHSRDIHKKQNRSAREKDYVMRTHLRNQSRGITKKVKR